MDGHKVDITPQRAVELRTTEKAIRSAIEENARILSELEKTFGSCASGLGYLEDDVRDVVDETSVGIKRGEAAMMTLADKLKRLADWIDSKVGH